MSHGIDKSDKFDINDKPWRRLILLWKSIFGDGLNLVNYCQ